VGKSLLLQAPSSREDFIVYYVAIRILHGMVVQLPVGIKYSIRMMAGVEKVYTGHRGGTTFPCRSGRLAGQFP
jgi:hypothetical protein